MQPLFQRLSRVPADESDGYIVDPQGLQEDGDVEAFSRHVPPHLRGAQNGVILDGWHAQGQIKCWIG